ncbi:stage III sporulation protein AF [Fuchsiella alkaliacetigena]|uniref:stage III sporulation protein AF n=1 Tax=Fuchsiella alkaliacetigena TaxID=957042 RepID=UPI00200AA6C3|nr:stage III sporulation protein AF [Fuchsiella alkaliacetigena]MCK8825455.1 stage III sporulation protein AF [Fuchsiella alkaliacetigena]
MLNQIHTWLKNLIVIILLTSFIELLLPQSSLEKYTRIVFGLFILIAILNPLLSFLDAGYNYNFQNITQVLTVSEESKQEDLAEIMRQGESLRESNQKLLQEDYEAKVARQMEALLSFDDSLPPLATKVNLGADNEIKQIVVQLEPEVEKSEAAKVNTTAAEEDIPGELKDRVKERLANFYGLSTNQISVQSN